MTVNIKSSLPGLSTRLIVPVYVGVDVLEPLVDYAELLEANTMVQLGHQVILDQIIVSEQSLVGFLCFDLAYHWIPTPVNQASRNNFEIL